MRVTQNMFYNQIRSQISSNASKLLEAQEIVATEKTINRVSDNAVDASRVMDIESSLADIEQYTENIDRMLSLTDVQDTTLGQVCDLITEAKELMLAESDDISSTTETREAARIELLNIIEQIVAAANTEYDGQYIFAGYATDTEPFNPSTVSVAATVTGGAVVTGQTVTDVSDLTGHEYSIEFTAAGTYDIIDTTAGVTIESGLTYTSGEAIEFNGISITISDDTGTPAAGDVFDVTTTAAGMVYSGDSGVQQIEIQAGTYADQNIPGDQLFQGSGLTDGVDVFEILNDCADALSDNDRDAISDLLDDIDAAYDQVLSERTAVGAQANLLTSVSDRHIEVQTGLELMRSDLEDADITEAALNYTAQQTIYEATLSTASDVIQLSLLDFLS